jgi:hypothetical protein
MGDNADGNSTPTYDEQGVGAVDKGGAVPSVRAVLSHAVLKDVACALDVQVASIPK